MDSVAMGRKGGLKGSEKQQLARRRNILVALAKRHPRSVRIRQELARTDTVPEWKLQCPLCGSVDPGQFLGKCAVYNSEGQPAHIFHWQEA